MKNKKLITITLIVVGIFLFLPNVSAKTINMYLFYGSTCPHCEAEIEYIEKEIIPTEDVKLYKYEVWENSKNKQIWQEIQKELNIEARGVPYLVIAGDHVLQGFRENSTEDTIDYYVKHYKNHNYKDKVGIYLGLVKEEIKKEPVKNNIETSKKTTYDIPLLGKIDAKNVSLPIIASIMGFVDGFNPCAMWILIFLITMLFDMKNRKKMWILGLTFIATSGIIYFMFMLSWLNLAMFINSINYIKIIIALTALGFGTYNIIRYFKTKNEVGCDVTNKKQRKRIINQIKNIVTNNKFILSIIGIITLAISVNIIELFCSLGLPVMFTEILSLNDISKTKYILYLIIYIIFFLIDDIIVFIVAMKTLKITTVSNKYAKFSHLVGGIIMLMIGLLMLLKPEWLMFNF